ncbi:hypothetical protein D3C78_862610 [compost metagenome]
MELGLGVGSINTIFIVCSHLLQTLFYRNRLGIKRNPFGTISMMLEKGGWKMFRRQERILIIVCFVVAVIMLYALIKSVARMMNYY